MTGDFGLPTRTSQIPTKEHVSAIIAPLVTYVCLVMESLFKYIINLWQAFVIIRSIGTSDMTFREQMNLIDVLISVILL